MRAYIVELGDNPQFYSQLEPNWHAYALLTPVGQDDLLSETTKEGFFINDVVVLGVQYVEDVKDGDTIQHVLRGTTYCHSFQFYLKCIKTPLYPLTILNVESCTEATKSFFKENFFKRQLQIWLAYEKSHRGFA